MNRLRIALHLKGWERLDYLTGCRIRWICDRYEDSVNPPGPHEPPHRSKCHCGDHAEYKDIAGQLWCWPCKYVQHDTCSCSHPPYTLPEKVT